MQIGEFFSGPYFFVTKSSFSLKLYMRRIDFQLLSNQIEDFFWSSVSLEAIQQSLRFFAWRSGACRTTSFGWVWPVVPLVQSDCRILWSSILPKETISALDFWHKDSYQKKKKRVSKSTTVGWLWPGMSNHTQTYYSNATLENNSKLKIIKF